MWKNHELQMPFNQGLSRESRHRRKLKLLAISRSSTYPVSKEINPEPSPSLPKDSCYPPAVPNTATTRLMEGNVISPPGNENLSFASAQLAKSRPIGNLSPSCGEKPGYTTARRPIRECLASGAAISTPFTRHTRTAPQRTSVDAPLATGTLATHGCCSDPNLTPWMSEIKPATLPFEAGNPGPGSTKVEHKRSR